MEPETPDLPSLVNSRDPTRIAGMFNRIAGRYDLMNAVMTFGQDTRWRRLAVDQVMLIPGESALDVATGTGDMARELAARVGVAGRVVAVDIAQGMLDIAQAKTTDPRIEYRLAGVESMEFDGEFDAVTVAFGFRNFSDRQNGVMSMARALKPRGRLAILELVPSQGHLKPLLDVYEQRIIPVIGRLIARDPSAYRYLPESVANATTPIEIERMMERAGLVGVRTRLLNFGTVAIVRGVKPA